MTTTLGALVQAEAALARLGAQPVAVKVAYHLAKLTKSVQAETAYYHEQRNAFIKEFGAERDVTEAEMAQGVNKGIVFEVSRENLDAFSAKMKELIAIPVTIDKWLLTLDMLEAVTISAGDLLALGALVEDTDG